MELHSLWFIGAIVMAAAVISLFILWIFGRFILSDSKSVSHERAMLTMLEGALKRAPCAIRLASPYSGQNWENDAFRQLPKSIRQKMLSVDDGMHAPPERLSAKNDATDETRWFSLRRDTESAAVFATDVTDVVNAENARGEIFGALTKTFSNLNVGLAVFDRDRRLAVFNPAITYLSELPVEFLSAKPDLMSFFDKLRDRQILPEPKNYANWRKEMKDILNKATEGRYLENWILPGGLTYRVTGWPQPGGAVAFYFEDISDEISMARRVQAQQDLRQSVLDQIDDAVAVIAQNNIVLFYNQRCRNALGLGPDDSLMETSLNDLMSACRKKIPAGEIWRSVETAILSRQSFSSEATGKSGRSFACCVSPLTSGATMLKIKLISDANAPQNEPALT